ncbi:hypothetical protein DUZ99_14490 [Xylanibacillus composti]|uniref:Uncharacterized protein n=1 Tax=Xylanibacillus composti TaxID=1572762 RepID=A0A8J4M1N4_9BACL|nr:hypothetical protein [Xylanibacillus composti]MDT9726186.1 hypothetical protein [Xylanibacillus composti]GIQ68032.1 hypothetical protein XYCOK13_08560 [Xylanibacillus composti]
MVARKSFLSVVLVLALFLHQISMVSAANVNDDFKFDVVNETVQVIENGEDVLTIKTQYYGDGIEVEELIRYMEQQGRTYTRVQDEGGSSAFSAMASCNNFSADFNSIHRNEVMITTIGSGTMCVSPLSFSVTAESGSVIGPMPGVSGITDAKVKNRLRVNVIGIVYGGSLFTATYDYSGPLVETISVTEFDESGTANVWASSQELGADYEYKRNGVSYSGTHWQ